MRVLLLGLAWLAAGSAAAQSGAADAAAPASETAETASTPAPESAPAAPSPGSAATIAVPSPASVAAPAAAPSSVEAPLGPEVLLGEAPLGPEVLLGETAPRDPETEGVAPPPAPAPGTDAPPGPEAALAPGALRLDTVSILGDREDVARLTGSAHKVDREQLERFEHDDVHRVLEKVPGVYVRDEEGFGLRPNIGLRGATSDRSRKVTLEEDGVLLAPAPYAAPAAYFFPSTTRMTAVEVFKGPASIEHGPQTIGGAVNLVTRPVPRKYQGAIDLGGGEHRSGKAHAWWGWGDETWGVLLEGVHLESAGFKELDDGQDTGFDKNEFMIKARYNTNLDAEVYHQVELKIGYSDEESSETYLGLTAEDFDDTPQRRYAASARDRMSWWRTQGEVRYALTVGEHFEARVVAYRNDFDRVWRKLNRFRRGPALDALLSDPESGTNPVYLGVLRGDEDSTPGETLLVGANDRRYVSQGVQVGGTWRWPGASFLSQQIRFGMRLHHDAVERVHDEAPHQMISGTLVREPGDADVVTANEDAALAFSAHALDEVRLFERLWLTPGLRVEVIRLRHEDHLADETDSRTDTVLVPGIGAFVQLTENLGALVGVHRGFSPVAPGQPDEVDPETSVNYEAGVRFVWPLTRGEVIGFFNDYGNLSGTCSLSSGCDPDHLDRQFDAGEVDVYGVEAALAQDVPVPGPVRVRVEVSYTLTLSEFQTGFQSDFDQFAEVEAGDALPYLPVHQGAATLSLGGARWGFDASALHTGEMRDVAGQGDVPEQARIPARTVVDLAGRFHLTGDDELYAKVDNVLGEAYIASRRPFGIRPGKPRQVFVGFKHRFGG